MANGIVQKLNGITFTGTLPKLQKDAIIPLAGAKFLFDFGNASTWAGGVVAQGATVNNLVSGAANATLSGTGTITPAGGGFDFASTNWLDMGLYDLSARQIVVIAWIKVPSVSAAYGSIVGAVNGLGDTTGQAAITINNNSTGTTGYYTPAPPGGTSSNTMGLSAPASFVANAVLQVAFSIGGTAGAYQALGYGNGAFVATSVVNQGASVTGLQSTTQKYGVNKWNGAGGSTAFAGRIYRVYAEDLTASGRTALSVVQADYTQNTGRFS